MKEIIQILEEDTPSTHSISPSPTPADSKFNCVLFKKMSRAICTIWSSSVHLSALSANFWRLTLQVLIRFHTFHLNAFLSDNFYNHTLASASYLSSAKIERANDAEVRKTEPPTAISTQKAVHDAKNAAALEGQRLSDSVSIYSDVRRFRSWVSAVNISQHRRL